MVGSHGRFVWYELTTTDADAAKAFYADVVGWGLCDASTPGAAYTLFTAGEVPVSYTHLDVYKRQVARVDRGQSVPVARPDGASRRGFIEQ